MTGLCADELNWQFDADEDYAYDSEFSQFSIFCHGSSRYAYNTLRGGLRFGDEAWPARMGDYHYQTTSHNGKTTTTHHHHFSYLLVELPYPSLPDLRIRREGIFDALAGAFGFDDIDFESAEFSKRFHVKSADKKFAYDVCYPPMMEFLLASEPPAMEIDGGVCCLYRRQQHLVAPPSSGSGSTGPTSSSTSGQSISSRHSRVAKTAVWKDTLFSSSSRSSCSCRSCG